MRARRYTVLIADRSSGVVRRVGVSLRPAIAIALGILAVPVLMGLGAKWSARAEIVQLQSANSLLQVENGDALAAATPSIWPAHGWLTGTFGGRPDPFTGEPDFHQGIDIATDKGNPVYATADATVASATPTGEYGNLIVLTHDFGLS